LLDARDVTRIHRVAKIVRPRAERKQEFDRQPLPVSARVLQRPDTRIVGRVDNRTPHGEKLDHISASVESGIMERRLTVAPCLRTNTRTVSDQELCDLDLPGGRCKIERNVTFQRVARYRVRSARD
jgi:hypothetical protein